MREEILSIDARKEYYTQEKCHILELSNSSNDPDVSIARARVEPGVTTSRHRLKETCERYVILSGEGSVQIGRQSPKKVFPGNVVIIPAGYSQQITNTGDDDLIFMAICSPRFRPDVYEDMEP